MRLEGIRFGFEKTYAEVLLQEGTGIPHGLQDIPPIASDRLRRKLLMDHIQLSANMAPEVTARAEIAAKRVGVTRPLELYQASGPVNAANLLNSDVCFISFRGDMISLLDEGSMLALFGHEMGHHLCHTTFASDKLRTLYHVSAWMAGNEDLEPKLRRGFARLSMAKEFTADRFGAIAAGGLEGTIRLMMSVVTGLPSHRLERDQEVYIRQARSLFGDTADSEPINLGSHPEHLLRTYALSLFAESEVFRELTGQGSGHRALAEIDAELNRILSCGEPSITPGNKDESLSPELMTFSCCAAVLMAASDGGIGDDEMKALEDTFSLAVPEWKNLLDHRRVVETYSELLPLAVQGGENAALSVFNILLHIMLSDRVVYEREIEMLLRVGRSLGQAQLFTHLLSVVTRELCIEQDDEGVEKDALPALPAGSRETADALNGLFAGLARRGGGVLPLGRVLKIMGGRNWTEEYRAKLKSALRGHPLVICDLPAAATGETTIDILNQNIEFSLDEHERKRREEEALRAHANALATAQSKAGLASALGYLRECLVDGDGRSPSIRLYKLRNSRHVDLVRLDRVVADRSERIVTMLDASRTIPLLSASEADRDRGSRSLATALRELNREAYARVEETGRRDVFVGYPFIEGVVNGYFVRAPLILHPFDLVGDGRGAGTYGLARREEDPSIANQALLRLLFAKKGFPCTDDMNRAFDAAAEESPEALVTALAKYGLALSTSSDPLSEFPDLEAAAATMMSEGLALRSFLILGFFPQSSSDLLKDYDDLLQAINDPNGPELSLALNAACQMLPAPLRGNFSPSATTADALEQPVIFADPSQRAAVRAARTSRMLVMDGPPGTGKSQTIVNLVADTLSLGGKVGIVCEKRVALDVVKQRLDSAGLGHLALVVHDVADDRKSVCKHLATRLEAMERPDWDDKKMAELRGEAGNLEDAAMARMAALRKQDAEGMSLNRLHLAAAFTRNTPVIDVEGISSIPVMEMSNAMALVRKLSRDADFFVGSSVLRAPNGATSRTLLTTATAEQIQEILDWLLRLRRVAAEYENVHTELPISWKTLENAGSFLETLHNGPNPDKLHAALFTSTRGSDKNQALRKELIKTFNRNGKALDSFPQSVRFQNLNALRNALAKASLHVSSPFRFLSSEWRSSKAVIKAALITDWAERLADKLTPAFLAECSLRADAATLWDFVDEHWEAIATGIPIPGNSEEMSGAINDLRVHEVWIAALWENREKAQSAGLWINESKDTYNVRDLEDWRQRTSHASRLLVLQRGYAEELHVGEGVFPHVHALGANGIASLCETFSANATRIQQADQILDQFSEWLPNPLQMVEAIADVGSNTESVDWSDVLLASWSRQRIKNWSASPSSANNSTFALELGGMEEISERLLKLHKDIAAEESKRLSSKADKAGLMAVDPAAPKARRTPEQASRESLLRECNKKRNLTPLRGLVRTFADKGLLDVAPIWLMSPETTAILFPREAVFDLIIVDEASQCTVECGLPVLTRARRVVVSGDERQMPPSSFFKAVTASEVVEESASEDGDSLEMSADALGDESLLALARGSGDPSPLRWHYRALYEELIAFSNHAMYGGELLTIPSTRSRSAAPALRWIDVPDGVWEDGCNRVEAEKVVDTLGEILSRSGAPSVGVVTFNIKQRLVVLNAIDARRSNDAGFAEIYDRAAGREDLDQRPFVKNLESVQGDERDVILFSLAYAPVTSKRKDGSERRYVPSRFGPLGQKGGERRLNVAVSRAKREVVVLSSFDPSLLCVAKTKNDGPRLFKAFLEFAHNMGEGKRSQAEKILNLVRDETRKKSHTSAREPMQEWGVLPLHHQIGEALSKLGYQVETEIGASAFRLPAALVHPRNNSEYILAIWGGDDSKEPDVFEELVHIPNVLKHRGWRWIWVDASEWHLHSERVVKKIQNVLDRPL